jgi:hypothetical protein
MRRRVERRASVDHLVALAVAQEELIIIRSEHWVAARGVDLK